MKEGRPVLGKHDFLTKNQILERLKKFIEDLKIIEQLSIYTTIYKFVSSENKERGRRGGYSLIVLNSNDNSIKVKTFGAEHIEHAMDMYLAIEKEYFEDQNVNVVLVNTGDIKKLEVSYPNYFMDTKKLVFFLSKIVMDQFLN